MPIEFDKWQEHDGRGAPPGIPDGVRLKVRRRDGEIRYHIRGRDEPWRESCNVPLDRIGADWSISPWEWYSKSALPCDVMAYQMPRPKALESLIESAANVDAVWQREDAE